ncbi:hypothetical protein IWQ56_001088 [Coemansia nantahalensis]|uniref:Uncharacterized protein n=1 Tax=Coemansia nantahalensis TaxID=2789366 RepID=A0ACC1K2R6_9FUNG|nr:hypothetical protein IWQ57_001858 [Coemansia nantahalensis]KAJ2773183.1 hypothetical protein IWQ56_001088 [Coemansia nantahalensis]
MTNSAPYALGAAGVSETAPRPRFSLLARADFVAAVDEFRDHFGQEVRSKTAEGYTFLGKDRAGGAGSAQRLAQRAVGTGAEQAASRKAHSAHGASPTRSSGSHESPPLNQPAAVHSRGSRAAAVAGGRTAASAASASNPGGESTLDNLLSYMKHSPKVAPSATRGAPQLGKGGGDFQKTVVLSQAQARVDALDIALPAHLSVALLPVERLLALSASLGRLTAQAETARAKRRSRPEEAPSRPWPKPEPEIGPDAGPAPDAGHARKRPASSLIFQIRVPKAARRQVIDAIAESRPGKRAAPSAAADGVHASPKRPRRPAAPERSSPPSSPSPPPSPRRANGKRPLGSAHTPGAGDSRARRPQAIRRNSSSDTIGRTVAGAAAATNNVAAGMTEAEVDGIRQQSQRLLALMRQCKHSGDAAREKGGRVEVEVGHYLESLACCLEDFWCRRVWLPPAEIIKNWSTMLGICEYVYKRCSAKDLAPLRGCASLVVAAVHYQLATESLETARGAPAAGQSGGDAAARDAAAYLADMSRHEQSYRALLDAHHVARQFPQTWACCQEPAPALGDFELRSHPHTKRWPPAAYPVGATSNPLDIANLVRQLCHEFLDRTGAPLQVPKG